jgi:Kae1-associated kinase Bud32
MKKIIQQGAEAIISLEKNQITKERISKSYRLPIIDKRLRKSRTKSEAKIINKLSEIINVPKIIESDNQENILMEFINGKKLSEHLEKLNWKIICKELGKSIAKIHNQDIIHGDLTTSNMILKDKELYLIDFGLGFHSRKIEDKAVDLHLLKQALEAKHFDIAREAIKIILNSYNANQRPLILERIKKIESRGRYKGH